MTYNIKERVRHSTRRLITLMAITAVILLGMGLAIGVWIGRHNDGPPVAAPPSPQQVSTSTSRTSSSVPSSTQSTTVNLDGLRWVDFNGIYLPVSPSAGPRNVGDLASGFSHDATGALMAAIHIASRTSFTMGSAIFRPTIQDQVIGDDQPKLLSVSESEYLSQQAKAEVDNGKPIRRGTATIRGFRLSQYGNEVTYLNALMSDTDDTGTTLLVDYRLQVRWAGSDWKLVAPVDGQWWSSLAEVGSTAGYTLLPERK